MIFHESTTILLIVLPIVDGVTDAITKKPHILQKIYCNEFVANVLRDDMGMISFDHQGYGGC